MWEYCSLWRQEIGMPHWKQKQKIFLASFDADLDVNEINERSWLISSIQAVFPLIGLPWTEGRHHGPVMQWGLSEIGCILQTLFSRQFLFLFRYLLEKFFIFLAYERVVSVRLAWLMSNEIDKTWYLCWAMSMWLAVSTVRD